MNSHRKFQKAGCAPKINAGTARGRLCFYPIRMPYARVASYAAYKWPGPFEWAVAASKSVRNPMSDAMSIGRIATDTVGVR